VLCSFSNPSNCNTDGFVTYTQMNRCEVTVLQYKDHKESPKEQEDLSQLPRDLRL
jgi:hypothetical protein